MKFYQVLLIILELRLGFILGLRECRFFHRVGYKYVDKNKVKNRAERVTTPIR